LTVKTKNSRSMLIGTCSIYGSKKCSFVKITTGNGFLNNLIGRLPVELHLPTDVGENVVNGSFNNLEKYTYCGPGTQYDKRVKKDIEV
jgi:hypothetical protein